MNVCSVFIAFALPAIIYCQGLSVVTSTAVSIQKTNVSWSLGTPGVEIKIAVSSVTFQTFPSATLTYTNSSGADLVSCQYLLTGAVCTRTLQCRISTGYSVACAIGGSSQFSFVLTIDKMKAGDNGALIKFPTSGISDISGWIFTPVTVYTAVCPLSLTGAVGSTSNSTCGYNCVANFSCDTAAGYVGSEVINTCTADYGVWSSPNNCSKTCNNTYFGSTATTAGNIVSNGQSQTFNCTCEASTVSSFVSVCGANGQWNETLDTIPCWKACKASEVTFGTPINNSFLCGTQSFSCDSSSVCSPRNFTLQCNANGTWVSLANPCTKDCGSPGPTTAATPNPTSTIVGSVLGVALAIVLLILGIYLYKRHMRIRMKNASSVDGSGPNPDEQPLEDKDSRAPPDQSSSASTKVSPDKVKEDDV